MSFNKVFLSGRLTNDPEIKANSTGLLIGNFSLAIGEIIKGQEYTSFINCVAFGKTAEILQQYIIKGSLIGVEGSLRQSRWEDTSGVKKSKIEVMVARIEIFEWRKSEGSPSNNFKAQEKNSPSRSQNEQEYYGEEADFIQDDSEIPF